MDGWRIAGQIRDGDLRRTKKAKISLATGHPKHAMIRHIDIQNFEDNDQDIICDW